MPRALVSVYNKDGLISFARRLLDTGWSLVASGGTESALRDAGIEVTPIEQVTGLVEMLDGRVKTLHPAIHAGILARDNATDMETLRAHGYTPINMVVCNLYPFQETVAERGSLYKMLSSRSTSVGWHCYVPQQRTSCGW